MQAEGKDSAEESSLFSMASQFISILSHSRKYLCNYPKTSSSGEWLRTTKIQQSYGLSSVVSAGVSAISPEPLGRGMWIVNVVPVPELLWTVMKPPI